MTPIRPVKPHARTQRRRLRWAGFLMGAVCAVFVLVSLLVAPSASDGQTPVFVDFAAHTAADGFGDDATDAVGEPSASALDAAEAWASEQACGADDRSAHGAYVPDQAIVVVGKACTPAQVDACLASFDFVETRHVDADDLASGAVTVDLAAGTDVRRATMLLQRSELVEFAQPNYYYRIQEGAASSKSPAAAQLPALAAAAGSLIAQSGGSVPNDPYASKQWALDAMNVRDAWDVATCDGSVGIVVIDEGFNAEHEDLKGVVKETYNAVTGTSDVWEISGQESHGTHVAGICGAQADNAVGIAGVSHNADLLLIQVCDDDGDITTNSLLDAYDYIMNRAEMSNIRVINVSLGGVSDEPIEDNALYRVIEKAYDAGMATVCAACNVNPGGEVTADDKAPFYAYPGDLEKSITVMNVAKSGGSALTGYKMKLSSTSNYNFEGQFNKDICAPGESAYSTLAVGYGNKNGTSMATPQVTGVLALMFAANPSLEVGQAASILYSTAIDLNTSSNLSGTTFDYKTGYGVVDAGAAVAAAAEGRYLDGSDCVDVGGTAQFSIASDQGADEASCTWSIVDGEVATVDEHGTVKGVSSGTTIVTAQIGDARYSRTIEVGYLISRATASGIEDMIYTGKAVTQRNAKLSFDGEDLVEGVDYQVSYADNVEIGTATVTFTGTGRYRGTLTWYFDIVAAPRYHRGATSMPVRSSSEWELSNCTLDVVSGTGVVSVDGSTVTARRAGVAKISIVDLRGKSIGAVSVTVSALSGKWKLMSAARGSNGAKRYLRIAGGSLANRANVCVGTKRAAGTVFKLVKQSGGTVAIKNVRSSKYVRVSGSKENKANVFQYAKKKTKAQRWRMSVDSSNRITFVNVKTGKALALAKAKPKVGTNVYQRTIKDKLAQKWVLVQAS